METRKLRAIVDLLESANNALKRSLEERSSDDSVLVRMKFDKYYEGESAAFAVKVFYDNTTIIHHIREGYVSVAVTYTNSDGIPDSSGILPSVKGSNSVCIGYNDEITYIDPIIPISNLGALPVPTSQLLWLIEAIINEWPDDADIREGHHAYL